ncbi:27becd11-8105-4468-8499-544b97ce47bd [Sclerotinia trifoliorum]|uniref:27becd11-8105-4468-8499-544b97ce47bd n=1 Tax=Sclerotinia trifoliorum TaxID=28548 RepID=A0A8H2W3N8_9HELO|nr:27becd11-8105-4468-8499-544b97ce47bd [Sclerotinia trifoliorum]
MKFSVVAATALLAGSAVAAPGTALRQARAVKRAVRTHGNPVKYVEGPTNKTDASYSSNWAGAVLVGTGYTSVTATFTAPSPSTAGSGSAWVGIDGDTCSSAILQTGIDWTKSGNSITYDAWYEWYPDYAYDFTGISISAGDSIKVTVTASSDTTGTATVNNLTKGKSVTHTFTGGVDGDLCEYNAEWIVEDFEQDGSLVQFANFGTVAFTSASATQNGKSVGITGAQIIDLQQSSTVLTSVSTGSDSITVKYV